MKRRRVLEPITPEEIWKIIETLKSKKYKGVDRFARLRTAMQILFMYFTGARPKECTNVKMEHINFKERTLYIPASSNKERFSDTIPIPDFVISGLMLYLNERSKYRRDSEWLFPSYKGNPVDRSVFGKFFRNAIEEAGLQQVSYIDKLERKRHKYTLYNLRSSYATLVYISTGGNIEKIKLMLRHRDPSGRSVWHYILAAQQALDRRRIMDEIFKKIHLDKNSEDIQ